MILEDFKIRVFLAVAEEGSFTRAARRLEISQPAVSMQVADLEKAVGAQLFERGRSAVALTVSGEAFLGYAERIRDIYQEMNHLFGKEGLPTRPVFIRATDFVASRYLPQRLEKIRAVTGVDFVVTTCPEGDVARFREDLQGADLLLSASLEEDGSLRIEKTVSGGFSRTPICAILMDFLQ